MSTRVCNSVILFAHKYVLVLVCHLCFLGTYRTPSIPFVYPSMPTSDRGHLLGTYYWLYSSMYLLDSI
jgi:hypothetical protein